MDLNQAVDRDELTLDQATNIVRIRAMLGHERRAQENAVAASSSRAAGGYADTAETNVDEQEAECGQHTDSDMRTDKQVDNTTAASESEDPSEGSGERLFSHTD